MPEAGETRTGAAAVEVDGGCGGGGSRDDAVEDPRVAHAAHGAQPLRLGLRRAAGRLQRRRKVRRQILCGTCAATQPFLLLPRFYLVRRECSMTQHMGF